MTTLFFRIASVFLMLTFSHYSLSDTSIQPISDTVVSNQQIAPPSNPLITHDLSPMGMYHAADWVVKSVMIALLVASILSWAVFITKQIQLVLATKRTKRLLATLVTARHSSACGIRSYATSRARSLRSDRCTARNLYVRSRPCDS